MCYSYSILFSLYSIIPVTIMRYSVSFIFLWMLHSLSLTDSVALLHEKRSQYYPVGLSFTCKDPGKPSYGHRTGYDFSIGASVTFGCYEGFVLVGSDRLTCQLKSSSSRVAVMWSDHIPVCVPGKHIIYVPIKR